MHYQHKCPRERYRIPHNWIPLLQRQLLPTMQESTMLPRSFLFFYILVTLQFGLLSALLLPSASNDISMISHRIDSALLFKKGSDDQGDKQGGMIGWFSDWKSKLLNSAGVPVPDIANRYHIRIRDLSSLPGRHVITRLMRYFPDLTWETANDIVETAFVNDVALVRIVNSVREAELAVDMLRKADPPIPAEIWDSKTEEILMI